jgi:two-component system CheB/CheR fusion protein
MRMPLSPATPVFRAPLSPMSGFDATMSFAYDELLDAYMPAGMLVTERRQLAHVFGDAGRFLKLRSGRPTSDVLELLDGDLKLALAGALQRSLRDETPVTYTGVRAKTLSGEEQLKVTVRPLKNRQTHVQHLFVALETMAVRPVAEIGGAVVDVDRASQEHVSALETELRHTRESLQAAVEELESSNEELQASNEELLASNEELQSTNEELHSVNEELYTVNAEYQKKITELTELTDDMDNLLQSTEIGTIFLDERLCIRKFTPQIGRTFPLLPQDVGRPIDGFSHNIRYANLLSDLENVLSTGNRIEKDVQDRSGSWLYLRILPYRSHSRLAGVVLSLVDISQLKQAEARLGQLAAIIESSNDAIIGMDVEGRIESWNTAAERLFGYTADEVRGRNQALLRADAERPAWSAELFERFRKGEANHAPVETQQRHKDGQLLDVQLSFSPIRNADGSLTGVSMIARDISDRKAAERSLSERVRLSELRADIGLALARADDLKSILDGCATSLVKQLEVATARIWTLDQEDRMLVLQSSAGRQPANGETRIPFNETVIGRIAADRKRVAIDDVKNNPRAADLPWTGDGGIRSFAGFPLIVSDRVVGVLGIGETSALPDNMIDELTSISFEIAQCIERKRSEEALREAERLAQEGVQRRDQFLAMLSHELRNPLAAVLNAASLLNCGQIDEQAQKEACGAIQRQSQQMARLLDDLLDVSRITTGNIQIRRETVNLKETAEGAIEAVRPLLESSGARFDAELLGEPLYVDGDPARLQQIQVNLLSNAAKYTPRGGRVRMSLGRSDGQAVINVRDDGIGIPAHMQERVFDLFVQLDGAPGLTEHGMGVGLALVKALVRMHDGTVSVHSNGPGTGSEFTVRLPLVDRTGSPVDVKDSEPQLAGLRLLLVDDNADIRRMSSRLLERTGCEVESAADGRQALDALAARIPDAALIDIGLPDMSGYEVAEQIRAATDGHSPFLIAVTGFGQPEDRRKALAAGFDAHLVKPISLKELLDLLAPLNARE